MNYDIVFIGGGPAGYEGAIAAAKAGLHVAVIEPERLGGTCLQRGCIPTKAILHSLKAVKMAREWGRLGIAGGEVKPLPEAIAARKNRIVAKLTKGIELLFKQNGVEWLHGRGQVCGSGRVLLDGEREITAASIVLATGSRPAELPFLPRDGKTVLVSDDLLSLSPIPRKMLVIGAGAVGLEWALIYSLLGTEVTVAEVMDEVLPGSDPEAAAILRNELVKQGLTIHTGVRLENPRHGEGVTLTLRQGEKTWDETFSHVLLSVGRIPRSEGTFIASSAPLALDARGHFVVDANLTTSLPGVYACGDVSGPPLLAHKASHQAIAVVDWIARRQPVHLPPIPAAVFTFPELANVGMSEAEALRQGIPAVIGRFPYSAGSRANAVDEKAGLVKVVTAPDGTVLGATIVGAEAGELMPLLAYAVAQRMPVKAFRDMVFIHPTLSENLWEAAGMAGGFAIHL